MKKAKKNKKTVSKDISESGPMPEIMLRNNIRFFAPFINPNVLSPFSKKTMKKFINEWNSELKRRGLKEERS